VQIIKMGTVAKLTGLRASAIRYYEAYELLCSQHLPNGYRVYNDDAITALHFLRRAQGFGITLREIKQLLELSR
jgi:MerR family transcriptional regulator, copper efflux regulator